MGGLTGNMSLRLAVAKWSDPINCLYYINKKQLVNPIKLGTIVGTIDPIPHAELRKGVG
jgi:hypothetical protein